MAIPEEKPDTRFHYSYSFYLEWIYMGKSILRMHYFIMKFHISDI